MVDQFSTRDKKEILGWILILIGVIACMLIMFATICHYNYTTQKQSQTCTSSGGAWVEGDCER